MRPPNFVLVMIDNKIKIVEFTMDETSEEVDVIGVNFKMDTQEMRYYENVVKLIRGQKWFREGNKTQGQLIENEIPTTSFKWFTVDYEVHEMDEDFDTEIDYLHNQVIIHPDYSVTERIVTTEYPYGVPNSGPHL